MSPKHDEAVAALMARDLAAFGADPESAVECRRAARAAFWDAELISTNLERAMEIAAERQSRRAA